MTSRRASCERVSPWPVIPPGRLRGRPLMKLRLAGAAGVLAGLAFGAPAGAIARPEVAGMPAGLERPVRVVQDRLGVPHVYARSDHDAFFANGYLQAQNRFFQMDVAQFFSRRAADGARSEVGGARGFGAAPGEG